MRHPQCGEIIFIGANLMQMHFHLKLYNASQFSIGVQIVVKISDHRHKKDKSLPQSEQW